VRFFRLVFVMIDAWSRCVFWFFYACLAACESAARDTTGLGHVDQDHLGPAVADLALQDHPEAPLAVEQLDRLDYPDLARPVVLLAEAELALDHFLALPNPAENYPD